MAANTTEAVGAATRRRRQDQMPREKTSLSLRADVVAAAKELVSAGQADNLSAFVELAVEEKVRRSKRAALYASYEAAALDDRFRERMNDVARDCDVAVSDGL